MLKLSFSFLMVLILTNILTPRGLSRELDKSLLCCLVWPLPVSLNVLKGTEGNKYQRGTGSFLLTRFAFI